MNTPNTPNASNIANIAIVGGGLAGLAAALTATDAGAQVTLYERAPRLGGATWSFARNGRWYDNGQHVFMRCCTEYMAFLDRVGVADHVTQQARLTVPVVRPNKPRAHIARTSAPAPLHLGWTLLRYSPLSLTQRIKAVRTALALRRLNPEDPSLDQLSFGDWLGARGESARAIAALWDLICLPTINLRAIEASLALAVKVFRTGLLDSKDAGDLGWAQVPLSVLHGAAASQKISQAGGSIALSTHVEAVGEGPCITVGGQSTATDAVVIAVPHDALDGLVPPNTVPHQNQLSELGASPIINVHFVFDRQVMDVPFAAALDSPVQFVFDRTEPATCQELASAPTTEPTQVVPTQVVPTQVVAVSQSAAFAEIGDRHSDIIERYRLALADLFPQVAQAEVLDAVVTREHTATFAGRVGTASLRPGPKTAIAGVFLAGAWTNTGWPATMEGAVRSGNLAAQLALEHCRAPANVVYAEGCGV